MDVTDAESTISWRAARSGGGDEDDSCGTRRANASTSSVVTSLISVTTTDRPAVPFDPRPGGGADGVSNGVTGCECSQPPSRLPGMHWPGSRVRFVPSG